MIQVDVDTVCDWIDDNRLSEPDIALAVHSMRFYTPRSRTTLQRLSEHKNGMIRACALDKMRVGAKIT